MVYTGTIRTHTHYGGPMGDLWGNYGWEQVDEMEAAIGRERSRAEEFNARGEKVRR